MKHLLKIVIGGFLLIGVLLAGALFTHNLWLTALAKWLIVEDPIVPVDLIVVSTGSRERIEYAVRLWKQGIAAKILLLSPDWVVIGTQKSIGDFVVEAMVAQGIPREQIVLDTRPGSTYEDAVYSREWAATLGVTSLLAIEDPFGMRRLRWTFEKIFANTDIHRYYAAVPEEFSDLSVNKWWTREQELLYVFEEYIKLIFYWIKY